MKLTVVLVVTSLLLIPALGLAILGIVALLVVLLLLILLLVASELAGLESLGGGLEGSSGSVRAETALLALGLLVHVELLLRLAGQVLVLRGGIVLPGVEVRHDGGEEMAMAPKENV